jgi:hypothetical protein
LERKKKEKKEKKKKRRKKKKRPANLISRNSKKAKLNRTCNNSSRAFSSLVSAAISSGVKGAGSSADPLCSSVLCFPEYLHSFRFASS